MLDKSYDRHNMSILLDEFYSRLRKSCDDQFRVNEIYDRFEYFDGMRNVKMLQNEDL